MCSKVMQLRLFCRFFIHDCVYTQQNGKNCLKFYSQKLTTKFFGEKQNKTRKKAKISTFFGKIDLP